MLSALLLLRASGIDRQLLDEHVAALQRQSGGRLGVAVRDLRTGETWARHGDERLPMQSVFKLPLAVVVLREVQHGRLRLDEKITVTGKDLSIPHSPISASYKGKRLTFTNRELLEYMVLQSDNTAADLLMRMVGGPARVTRVLKALGVSGIRVDRYESELNSQYSGLGPFRPEWSDEKALEAAIAKVPIAKQRAALQAWLKDPRDTATPLGMLDFLRRLDEGRLLDRSRSAYLLGLIRRTRTGANRLMAGFPKGTVFANRTGAGRTVDGVGGAMNQVGIAELPDGRRIAIVVFLAGSKLPWDKREAVLADVARAVVKAVDG